jgi:hypothetical protein
MVDRNASKGYAAFFARDRHGCARIIVPAIVNTRGAFARGAKAACSTHAHHRMKALFFPSQMNVAAFTRQRATG